MLACFRYNPAVHSATICSPFRAMFGVEAFHFGVDINLRSPKEEEPAMADLGSPVKELHEEIITRQA